MSEAATHRAKKLDAVPSWLTKQHEDAIVAKFQEAIDREEVTGVPHAVDHVVPLVGICRKTWLASGMRKRLHVVCGLHVPKNLEPLPLGINRDIKSDWFDSDWPAWPTDEVEQELNGFERDDGDDDIPF